MVTVNQLILGIRKKRKFKIKKPALDKCPQKKGFCLRILLMTPKKPNSAIRKVARVLLSNLKQVSGYIPGKGHNLQKHSAILIRGGRVRDLPGIKYKIIRGKFDLKGVVNRRSSRSKYGVKIV
jgi:small subunit ribosomal protein S12